MDNLFWFIGIGVALIILMLVVLYFRQTPEQRTAAGHRKILQERLSSLPSEQAAILLEGKPKLAAIRATLHFSFFSLIPICNAYRRTSFRNDCEIITSQFGMDTAFVICFVLPCIFIFYSFWHVNNGWKILSTRYAPPLGSVVFSDTITIKHSKNMLAGVISLTMPLIGFISLLTMSDVYTYLSTKSSKMLCMGT